MTATRRASDERADRPHPLLRGASPATVRAWLLPDDVMITFGIRESDARVVTIVQVTRL